MAGIYIHIPFCKQKCSYCDFHFSTSLKYKSSLIDALIKEIESKKGILKENISSIYFGGGTPSLLSNDDLLLIIDALNKNYTITPTVEITFECNPDDISKTKLNHLKNAGINRLSIGIQSFFEEDLKLFNRAHNSTQAKKSILLSQDAGFDNITVDLIYGSPLLTQQKWEDNLTQIGKLNIPHLSAYTLTVEPNTALQHQVKSNQIQLPSDEQAIAQFKTLIEMTEGFGLNQYEISNFGKEDYYSYHNSNYWKGVEYLGFGPSAHSYINNKRIWNISNNIKYIKAINETKKYWEEEVIDEITAYNEYILTRLRTIWGIEKNYISENFNLYIFNHFIKELAPYLKSSYLQVSNNKITLTKEGIFIADKISSDLFFVK
ncbi:MAG: radical SAM family heme chaperone HemW [Flavobacteriales bacterium]|nr:radical SAM family heme chaperone HemW [Flavobacteriales bacterium]MCB9363663.1 radical SAM family heme chaperone HemW [Flavobacteriales bacterium]